MSQTLLRAENLGRRVAERWLWRGVTVQLGSQQRLALKGPSGAGKTLLLRALAGLDAAQEGQVRLQDKALAAWAAPLYRTKVSYLHQRPALFEGTVEDNLRRPFALQAHRAQHFDRERVVIWLEHLGRNEGFLGLSAATLSGGEGQLTALLRTLQLNPLVLLLDEATASLDPETVLRAESLLADWLTGGESACIWTSHDPAQLARVADSSFDLTGYLGGR